MQIKEYIENIKPETICDIPFLLIDVNFFREKDVNEKTSYDDDEKFSFTERLDMARREIEKDLRENKLKSIEDVFSYYNMLTERGNCNYWGEMCFISTSEKPDDSILYGVRMD